MTTTLIAAGLGMAAIGYGGRFIMRNGKNASKLYKTMESTVNSGVSGSFSKYYKGGFDTKMSRREACLILGVSPSAPSNKIKEAHRRIMLLNHPDRGGSPLVAAKINEAKDYLESKKP